MAELYSRHYPGEDALRPTASYRIHYELDYSRNDGELDGKNYIHGIIPAKMRCLKVELRFLP